MTTPSPAAMRAANAICDADLSANTRGVIPQTARIIDREALAGVREAIEKARAYAESLKLRQSVIGEYLTESAAILALCNTIDRALKGTP